MKKNKIKIAKDQFRFYQIEKGSEVVSNIEKIKNFFNESINYIKNDEIKSEIFGAYLGNFVKEYRGQIIEFCFYRAFKEVVNYFSNIDGKRLMQKFVNPGNYTLSDISIYCDIYSSK